MESYTLGNTNAATILVELLDKLGKKSVTRRVTKILIHYFTGLRNICPIPDPKVRESLLTLWRDHHVQMVGNSAPVRDHTKIVTYTINVINTEYRRIIRGEVRQRENLADPMTPREAFDFLYERYIMLLGRPASGNRRGLELDEIEALYVALSQMREHIECGGGTPPPPVPTTDSGV